MATGSGGNDDGNWWDGWLQAAKEKSAVALQQMKRDLGEFGNTIQRDTSTAVAASAGVIRDNLQTETNESSTSSRFKKGFSDLLGGLSESLTPKNLGKDEATQAVPSKTSHHIFDRAKARLHSMQIDAGTYCTNPEGPAHVYEDWLHAFDTDNYKGDISDLLVSNTDVRAIYTKLVPAVVSNADFWGRYFYKVRQLEQDEARRTALKERAEMTSSQTFDAEELQWDEDEEDPPVIVESLEARNSPVKQQDHGSRLARLEGSEEVDERLECRQPSGDEKEEQATLTEQPCQHHRQTEEPPGEAVEPETEPADHEDKATTVTSSSTTEQEIDTGNRCVEPLQRVLDTRVECDTKTVQPGRDEIQSTGPKEADNCTLSGDSKPTQAAHGRNMDVETLMVHTPTEETPMEKQIETKSSPSGSDASNKDSSLSDDWERDFDDIDVTEEDLTAAAAAATKTKTQLSDDEAAEDLDDWENWE